MIREKHRIALAALAMVASFAAYASAQTYDRTYAKALILPGGGTDAIHNLTITLNSSTNTGITWTLPATNINGLFSNDGAGNISWATTLPSGLTIPSPIFTGTISFAASSIPVADLVSNTIALTSSGSTLTFSGGNGSGAVALGGTAGNYDLNLTTANTWTGAITENNAGIATTYTNGLTLENTTASTSGATVQQSPSQLFLAHDWSTTSTAADSLSYFRVTNVPISSANPLVSNLTWAFGHASAQKSADFTNLMQLSNAGTLTLGNANGSTGTTGSIALANSGNSNLTTIKAPSGAPVITYTLPSSAPTASNIILTSSTSGGLSWSSAASLGGSGTMATGGVGDGSMPGNNATIYYYPFNMVPGGDKAPTPSLDSKNVGITNLSGTFSNLQVVLDGAPGTGVTVTTTIYYSSNGGTTWNSTGITVPITGASTTGSDNSDSFTITAGWLISINVTVTGTLPGPVKQEVWAFSI